MISIIVAMTKNRVIGKKGEIPWVLSDDLKHFAQITRGHTVVMGRKTYESIMKRLGHKLPDRNNVVITTQGAFRAPGCLVVQSADTAIKLFADKPDEMFVIGGGEIYRHFLPVADKLYVTEVSLEYDGDVFFPPYSKRDWKLVRSEPHRKDEKNPCDFTFLEFIRIRK